MRPLTWLKICNMLWRHCTEHVHRRCIYQSGLAVARICFLPHFSLSPFACRLYVAGHSLAPGLWCEQSVRSSSSPLYERSIDLTEEEEVYEAEGSIEEFLAYDGKEMYITIYLLLNLQTFNRYSVAGHLNFTNATQPHYILLSAVLFAKNRLSAHPL